MTAEKKKGKYIYYRCTGFKGPCGNTYIREEKLSDLLGTTVKAVQIPPAVADRIATAIRDTDGRAEHERLETKQRLERRRRTVLAKLDRGYDDYVSGKISDEFWTRRSEQWEEERRTVEGDLTRLEQADGRLAVAGERILELAKKAEFLYKTQNPSE
jgi:hypothetical protein